MSGHPVTRLTPRHEQALILVALGFPIVDAAHLIGITPQRMSSVYRSALGQSFVLALQAKAIDYAARMIALGLTPQHIASAQGGGDPAKQARTTERKARAATKARRRERRLSEAGEGSEDPGLGGDGAGDTGMSTESQNL